MRWLAPFLLTACFSACATRPQGPPEDQALARLAHAGDTAYRLERPEEAVTQYQASLSRARTRDDATAIADAGFNLAAAELRTGRMQAAIATAQEVQDELARRGLRDYGLDLVMATALFRVGDLQNADRIAEEVTTRGSHQLADQGWFLRGLIGDMRGDRVILQRALSSLSPSADPADIAELQARIDRSSVVALKAAGLRRDALDYRGMARTLALAAQLTPGADAAADLYLRAGRSAAGQGDPAHARVWFRKAQELAHHSALRTEATAGLRSLTARTTGGPEGNH